MLRAGIVVERINEVSAENLPDKQLTPAHRKAHREFPLFLGIRARRQKEAR